MATGNQIRSCWPVLLYSSTAPLARLIVASVVSVDPGEQTKSNWLKCRNDLLLLPRLKHAKMESPSDTQTVVLISDESLHFFQEGLQDRIDFTKEEKSLRSVSGYRSVLLLDENPSLVTETQFMRNVREQRQQFVEMVKKAAKSPLNDLKAIIFRQRRGAPDPT